MPQRVQALPIQLILKLAVLLLQLLVLLLQLLVLLK
jgi:hypothetical protein